MLYREAGQFKTTYAEDMAIFPIRQDRIALAALLGIAFIGVPLLATFHIWPFGSDYLLWAILLPFLILALAAIGTKHSRRLLRPNLARQRRVHGHRRLFRLQNGDGRSYSLRDRDPALARAGIH